MKLIGRTNYLTNINSGKSLSRDFPNPYSIMRSYYDPVKNATVYDLASNATSLAKLQHGSRNTYVPFPQENLDIQRVNSVCRAVPWSTIIKVHRNRLNCFSKMHHPFDPGPSRPQCQFGINSRNAPCNPLHSHFQRRQSTLGILAIMFWEQPPRHKMSYYSYPSSTSRSSIRTKPTPFYRKTPKWYSSYPYCRW